MNRVSQRICQSASRILDFILEGFVRSLAGGAIMRYGAEVEVTEAFENKVLRRVVATDERNVYVCTEREFREAEAGGREPVSIGFPRQFVLRVVNEG
jgi:hypothetical protein